MRFFWLLMLLLPCAAQTPHVYLDLSGPWTRTDPGRPPRPFTMPRRMFETEGPFRLEREITLPDSGLTGLALLMTPLGGSFEVKVNGQAVGGLQSSNPLFAPPLRSVVLPVPDGLLHTGNNILSVEVGAIKVVDRISTTVPPGQPMLGGAAELRAIAEGQERAYQLQRIYMPVDTVAQFLFCAILIWLSPGAVTARRCCGWRSTSEPWYSGTIFSTAWIFLPACPERRGTGLRLSISGSGRWRLSRRRWHCSNALCLPGFGFSRMRCSG